jgi:septum formation protein
MDFFEKLKQYDIILASQSPRRRELLELSGIPFRVLARPFSEHFPDDLPPHEVVMMLCKEKSRAYLDALQQPVTIVITADTIVVNQGKIMNKPSGRQEALEMLHSLSGRSHQVLTGVCIRHRDLVRVFYETTTVFFRNLSTAELDYYVEQYQPFDKAGAYGIQEWIGYVGIGRIEGSYPNVVGLPVERLYVELQKLLME